MAGSLGWAPRAAFTVRPRRSGGSERWGRVAAVCVVVCGFGRADAAFEVRLWEPAGAPHLPWYAPAPIGATPAAPGALRSAGAAGDRGPSAWSVGVLHAALFGLEEIRYDAAAALWEGGGRACALAVTRLGAPGAAEWTVAARAEVQRTVAVTTQWLAFVPGSASRSATGLPARSALTTSLLVAPSLFGRARAWFWAGDLVSFGDAASLGLAPRVGLGLSGALGHGLHLRLARTWTPAGPGGRFELGWDSGVGLLAAQGWGSHQGARETTVSVTSRSLEAGVYSASLRSDLPSTSGAVLSFRRTAPSGRRNEAQAVPRPGGSPPAVRRSREPVLFDGLADLPVDLSLDGEAILDGEERDSLGIWSDSLAWQARSASEAPAKPPLPVRAAEADLLRRWTGIDSTAAARLAGALRRGRVPADSTADPELHRSWLEAAPYLTTRSGSAGRPVETRASTVAPGRLAWRRDLRARSAGRPSAADRFDLRLPSGAWSVSGAWRPGSTHPLNGGRGALLIAGSRLRIATATGGDPLVWGTGLIGRALPLSLRSAAAGSAREAPETGGIPATWQPGLGGDRRSIGGEVEVINHVRFVLGARQGGGLGALVLTRGRWLGGLAVDRVSGVSVPDLWVRRSEGAAAAELEVCREMGPVWVHAGRVAALLKSPGSGVVGWFDGRFRRRPDLTPAELEARPTSQTVLLRSGRIQAGLRRGGWTAGVTASEETRVHGGASPAASRRRRVQGATTVRWGVGGELSARVEIVSNGARPIGSDSWEPLPWTWRRRARLRGEASHLLPLEIFHARWEAGSELGWERSWRAGSDRESLIQGSTWWGGWAAARSRGSQIGLGLLEVFSRSTVDVAPTWSNGARARLRAGVALAAGGAWRHRRLGIRCSLLQPLVPSGMGRAFLSAAIEADLLVPWRRPEMDDGTSFIREEEVPP